MGVKELPMVYVPVFADAVALRLSNILLVLRLPRPVPLNATVPLKFVAGLLKKSWAEIITLAGAPTICGVASGFQLK